MPCDALVAADSKPVIHCLLGALSCFRMSSLHTAASFFFFFFNSLSLSLPPSLSLHLSEGGGREAVSRARCERTTRRGDASHRQRRSRAGEPRRPGGTPSRQPVSPNSKSARTVRPALVQATCHHALFTSFFLEAVKRKMAVRNWAGWR